MKLEIRLKVTDFLEFIVVKIISSSRQANNIYK